LRETLINHIIHGPACRDEEHMIRNNMVRKVMTRKGATQNLLPIPEWEEMVINCDATIPLARRLEALRLGQRCPEAALAIGKKFEFGGLVAVANLVRDPSFYAAFP
jgi:hypothetical protein